MRVLIEESIHEAELGIAGGADIVILAYPDHLWELEQEKPYTHIHCRTVEAAQAVLRLLPKAWISGDSDDVVVLYFNGHASHVISALGPLFVHTRGDDLQLVEAFDTLVNGPQLQFIGVIQMSATDRRLADSWMTELLPAGFMAQVEAATAELTARYEQSGSIRDAIGAMGFNADEILGQVNGILGVDAEALLAQAADYTNQPAVIDPTKRPHFGPDQVRSYKELKYGHFYVLVDAHGRRRCIRFKRIEWRERGPVMIYESAEKRYARWGETYAYLGDSGLAPYADRIYRWWNPTNHVLRAPRTSRFVITKENGKIVKRQRRFYN